MAYAFPSQATDSEARARVRRRVLENVHKLFHQQGAVDAWSDLLQRLAAPAQQRRCAPSQPIPPPDGKTEL